jgi:putative membrane-bound dehydrogenase-like protein
MRKSIGFLRAAALVCGLFPLGMIARAAEFPTPYNSEKDTASQALKPAEAAAGFRAPKGFNVSVFASEPDVQNPIAMAWDPRGRLWIAENYTYSERPKKFDLDLRDRVIILEDTDGDGRSDRRRVFTDRVQMLTGIEIGYGGVWLMCPPAVIFIPDRDGDDVPDGEPEIVVDGFDVPTENYHNFANGLRWGPDGWLYGRCGASSPGRIGLPGTPMAERRPLNGGVWRYHPATKAVEVVCHGTTNPWGLDWNEYGEPFFINTVNGHLWHAIPGAHFRRPHTVDPNPRVYVPMEMHADHWHWDTGQDWTASRSATGEHDRLGGGHAHSGTMVYLGDNWPAEYRGRLMTLNLHGRRVNVERLERSGSGYVAKHEPDILNASDPWFRGIELGYGPDGGVYVLDWSDTGECHEATGVHRTSGRIYKVTHGNPARRDVGDLAKLDWQSLVGLLKHENEWFARQARQLLAERIAAGQDVDPACVAALTGQFEKSNNVVHRLRALWSLYSIGSTDESLLMAALTDREEQVRTWAVRILTDNWPLDKIVGPQTTPTPTVERRLLETLARLAATDSSGLVRLALASTLNRLPVKDRPALAAALISRGEDAQDQNLSPLIWYGLIPVADVDPAALADLAKQSKLPLVRRWITRRLAEDIDPSPTPVNDLVMLAAKSESRDVSNEILTGLAEGLAGRRKAPRPAAWDALQARASSWNDTAMTERVRELSVVFGDGRAMGELIALAQDKKTDLNVRRAALQSLIEQRPPELRSICEKLLYERFINSAAIRGLAMFDDPALGAKLASSYRSFHPSERSAVIETLVARPAFAKALLNEVAAGKIPATEISPFQARQILSFKDDELAKKLREHWGELRDSPEDKRRLMADLKAKLAPKVLAQADKSRGRAIFTTACANCHRLYGQGGQIGPDLTGAGRHNIDYLLDNIVDPSATVSAGFRMSVAQLSDGRVINGIVTAQTPKTITLQTAKEAITVERSDIDEIAVSTLSLMPDALLQPLQPDQIRDLFAYLMHPTQVPLPEKKE